MVKANGAHPLLLTMPTYGGTLAATRCLGERGIPITMAGQELLAPARWSRHVTRWVKCPSILDAERFFDWLVDFGRANPRHVLYPTCDDLAWLLADRAHVLSEYFDLYQPSSRTILDLLDKRSLYRLANQFGIRTLPTAFPRDTREAVEMAPEVGFPLLLKSRTQILLATRGKGVFVESADELPREFAEYVPKNPFFKPLVARVPGIDVPMLQAFRPDAAENIYSVSGFIGPEDGELCVRAAVKVLQRPRRLGVGLCFEEAPVDERVLSGLLQICRAVGYFGVFEAEFVREEDEFFLIDLNPRFYGQMGFDTARRLPLPYLVWLGALGRTKELAAELACSAKFKPGAGYVYTNRLFFNVLLSLQRVGGRMTVDEAERWRRWLRTSSERSLAFDSVDAPHDRLPAVASALTELYSAVRHPRSFLRQMVIGP
jgi:predicted ATP-grasp superfamily ATP-dependent carboligase